MWIIFLLVFILPLAATEFKETTLDNGMKVVIMNHITDDNEIYFQLTAKGGFASLPKDDQASAKLSSEIMWEVGLDNMTAEEISKKLYDNGSDLQINIEPLYRKISGTTDLTGLDQTFEIVKLIFTKPKLNDEQLAEGLRRLKVGYREEQFNPALSLDIQTRLLNSNNWPTFLPLNKKSLETINFNKSRLFYKKAFSNPADYILVIVGPVQVEKTLAILDDTLAKIPPQILGEKSDFFDKHPVFPLFTEGRPIKRVVLKEKVNTVTRLTFPLNFEVTQKNFEELALLTRILSLRFRTADRSNRQLNGVDVSYEFPYYPYLDQTWLTITLFCPGNLSSCSVEKVMRDLNQLLQIGPTQKEIDDAISQVSRNEKYWHEDAEYWLLELTNLYMWNWNPEILHNNHKSIVLTTEEAKKRLNEILVLDHYTEIISSP